MSDPLVAKMTPTQWVFELEGLASLDERKYQDIEALVKIGRSSFIDLMGLNLMPVEDTHEDEFGNEITTLRRPKDTEVMPLALLCGNEAMLSEVTKKNQELQQQEELESKLEGGVIVERTPEELDEFIDDGDVDFPDDPEQMEKFLQWKSPETQSVLKSMVKPLDEKDAHLNTTARAIGPPRKKSRVKVD